jgi:hypothetical protein
MGRKTKDKMIKNKIILPQILLSLRAVHGVGNLSPIISTGNY